MNDLGACLYVKKVSLTNLHNSMCGIAYQYAVCQALDTVFGSAEHRIPARARVLGDRILYGDDKE